MKISKISQISGKEHTIDIPMERKEFVDAYNAWIDGKHIQIAFHMLNDDEREFIMTGITKEEWENAFPPEDEDDLEIGMTDSETGII